MCPVCQLDPGTLISVSGVMSEGGTNVSTRYRLRSLSTLGYEFPNCSYITLIRGLWWELRAYQVLLEVPPFVCLADLSDVRFGHVVELKAFSGFDRGSLSWAACVRASVCGPDVRSF